MAEDIFKPLKDVLSTAQNFVDEQKGKWDDLQWQEFLNDMQKKGIEVSDEMKNNAGAVLESMKNVYNSMSATDGVSASLSELTNDIVQFVKKQKGTWNHAEWEALLESLQKKGMELTDETKNYVGGILEAAKKIYTQEQSKQPGPNKTTNKTGQ